MVLQNQVSQLGGGWSCLFAWATLSLLCKQTASPISCWREVEAQAMLWERLGISRRIDTQEHLRRKNRWKGGCRAVWQDLKGKTNIQKFSQFLSNRIPSESPNARGRSQFSSKPKMASQSSFVLFFLKNNSPCFLHRPWLFFLLRRNTRFFLLLVKQIEGTVAYLGRKLITC